MVGERSLAKARRAEVGTHGVAGSVSFSLGGAVVARVAGTPEHAGVGARAREPLAIRTLATLVGRIEEEGEIRYLRRKLIHETVI